ncbi:hypothetical protein CSKR_107628 [Clonorchis sinensis]|uniref:Uncharacterized protein n=1 Tax=Clonorchis sinensis TaxID=79923 RepID=A0A3R7CBJ6_CLOSI|nr:hypothetical protein CSKR_107628 [Clonorchis sinensis]
MCCTRPPHVPVVTIFEISRYMYIRNALLIRLLKTRRQPTTGFALLGAHHKREIQLGSRWVSGKNSFVCKRVYFANFLPSSFSSVLAKATKRLRQFRRRSHFSRDAKQIYEKTYYSNASLVQPLYLESEINSHMIAWQRMRIWVRNIVNEIWIYSSEKC